VQLLPHLNERFDNSDYNALLNNATTIANALNVQKVNYDTNPFTPANIDALRSGSAEKAQVQEYIYNSAGIVRGRYTGKQLTGARVNEWQRGDTSYGKTPVVEQKTPYFCVFNYISGFSPEHNQANAIVISYIVDEVGNVLTPDAPESQPILQQSFTAESKALITVQGSTAGGSEANLLGEQVILRGGSRIEPIVYSYTAATYLEPSYSPASKLQFFTRPTLPTYDAIATGSQQFPSRSKDVTTKVLFQRELKDDALHYADGTTSVYSFAEDTKQPVKFTANIAITGSGEYIPSFNSYVLSRADVVIESSPNSTFINPTSLASIGFGFRASGSTEIKLETSYLNFASGSSIRVTVTPRVSDPGSLTLGRRTFQAISEQSGSTFVSQSDNAQGYFFTTNSNPTNTILTASLSLSGKYENYFVGVSGSTNAGFNTVNLPFTLKVGDEIKFNADEKRTYLITGVQAPFENPEKTLYVTLNDRPNTAVSASYFAIRRYVDTPDMVLMRIDRVAGTQKSGILYPKYPSDRLKANYNGILSTLLNKGIL
jgi:hypothetical protein